MYSKTTSRHRLRLRSSPRQDLVLGLLEHQVAELLAALDELARLALHLPLEARLVAALAPAPLELRLAVLDDALLPLPRRLRARLLLCAPREVRVLGVDVLLQERLLARLERLPARLPLRAAVRVRELLVDVHLDGVRGIDVGLFGLGEGGDVFLLGGYPRGGGEKIGRKLGRSVGHFENSVLSSII